MPLFPTQRSIKELSSRMNAVERVLADLEAAIKRMDTDRDDLWERVHRQQAKNAARARRELAKQPEKANTVEDLDIAIKEGRYHG